MQPARRVLAAALLLPPPSAGAQQCSVVAQSVYDGTTVAPNVKGGSAAACCASCANTTACRYFTWHPQDGEAPSVCYLYHDGTLAPTRRNFSAGRTASAPPPPPPAPPAPAPAPPAPAPPGDECSDDGDCYGGTCAAGACACPPSWTGPRCQLLRLRPAEAASPGLLLRGASTWGGGAVQADDGVWHMFAARIAGACGLDAWWPNSEVAHAASAAGPAGPYTVTAEPVLPAFSHGPKPARMPDGTLALAHIGCGDLSTPRVGVCRNGSTPRQYPRPTERSRCNQPGWTGVLTAGSALGPWAQLEDPAGAGLSVDGGAGAWHTAAGLTNPSLWVNGTGTVLLAYSAGCPGCKVDASHKHSGLAVGPLGGPYRDLTPAEPIFPWAVEDPCVFRDPDSGYYHVIGHRTGNDGPGASNIASHAVAPSPAGPWRVAGVEPYSRDIEWRLSGGAAATAHVQKRERPQVIDRAGALVALSNGVRPGDHPTPVSPGGFTYDWTYTHVQLIDRAA